MVHICASGGLNRTGEEDEESRSFSHNLQPEHTARSDWFRSETIASIMDLSEKNAFWDMS